MNIKKASIIVLMASTVLLILFFFHYSNKYPTTQRYRRLEPPSNFPLTPNHHAPLASDPIVAELERRRKDKQYFEHSQGVQAQPEGEDLMDAEDDSNDDDRFDVTSRLIFLFPKVDVDPVDGFISERELKEWNLQQAQREVLHRSLRQMEILDKNHDGFVSFSEYNPPSNDSCGYDMGWWKEEHFNASDADGDGLLNLTEFNDFLHPADSKNPKLLEWLCKEEVRERDTDKDGKVNFKEFFHGISDLIRNYDEENHQDSHHSDDSRDAPARMLFTQLDKDGDGYLSSVELLPVIRKLHRSECYHAKQQADYIISQADVDKDGQLTLTEMIENPYVFYSAIFNDDEDEFDFHDKFS